MQNIIQFLVLCNSKFNIFISGTVDITFLKLWLTFFTLFWHLQNY